MNSINKNKSDNLNFPLGGNVRRTKGKYRFILSGGGTGGHIYPAIAIADELKARCTNAEFLFVGASDRMEMDKVPHAGYAIKGLWISGLQRKLTLKNLLFPVKVLASLWKSYRIIQKFKPDAVIGTGGFASGPLLKVATLKNIPCVIQEQNSFPGITNKLLAKKVNKICVAYEGLERFFPKQKIVLTGNPVRKDLLHIEAKRDEAITNFKLKKDKLTLLVLGGSLGARRINQLIEANLNYFEAQNIQVLWQCGKLYYEQYKAHSQNTNVQVHAFLNQMDLAYAAADIIISRAGAISVSELCIVGKPVVFIPSPNVAEDHQTKNAQAVATKNAAILIKEADLEAHFQSEFSELIANTKKRETLSKNIKALALPNATKAIVNEIEKLLAHLPSSQREETPSITEKYNVKNEIDKKVLPFGKGKGRVFFIGIGGIGMSALARYFVANGKQVAGYDKTPTNITKNLQNLGVAIHFEDDISQIEQPFLNSKDTLIVYTPAIPQSHTELQYFKANGFQVLKRSEVLGLITQSTTCLAVAGTHGKTTTTSILAHLLASCNSPVTGFLGGISENYNSNLVLKGTEVTVVEADEFDRSFLTLSPDFACITSMDADHLDIYGNASELQKSFVAFTKRIKPNGKLFVKNGLPLDGITYGIEDNSEYCAQNIKIENGNYVFNLKTPEGIVENLSFQLPGRHNLANATAALAMALEYGCDAKLLASALQNYKGVKRRFSYQIKTEDFVFIDDYAHHPEELNAVHQAVSEMYPKQNVLAIFQPHLFSRTKDFADEFAKSLSKFDEILLLDIYPARELPIKGVTSQWLLDKIENPNKKLVQKSQLISEIKQSKAKVVLTLGAGDIGEEVQSITQAFTP